MNNNSQMDIDRMRLNAILDKLRGLGYIQQTRFDKWMDRFTLGLILVSLIVPILGLIALLFYELFSLLLG